MTERADSKPISATSAQALLLLVGVSDQLRLQADGQRLLTAVGGGDEAVQAGALQEVAQQADAGGPGQMEDQVQGQQQAAQKAIADGTLEEGHQFGFEVGMLGLLVCSVLLLMSCQEYPQQGSREEAFRSGEA